MSTVVALTAVRLTLQGISFAGRCVQEGMRRPMLSPAEQDQIGIPIKFLDLVPVGLGGAPQGPLRET